MTVKKTIQIKPKSEFDVAQLQALLTTFKQTLGDLYRKETSAMHCSLSHLEIMHYLSEHQYPTMKDVAGHLRITPPSVTTLVDAMAEQGLVKRQNVSGDRRSVRLSLTPKAKKLHLTLQKKKTLIMGTLLKKLSTEQKQQLSDIISTLVT